MISVLIIFIQSVIFLSVLNYLNGLKKVQKLILKLKSVEISSNYNQTSSEDLTEVNVCYNRNIGVNKMRVAILV